MKTTILTKTFNVPTIDQVNFSVIVHPEEIPVRGNAIASGDDRADKRAEDSIIRQLENGNNWAWCTVEVKATWKSFSASDYLGCCSYKSQKDFEKGGYFQDMKEQAFGQIFSQIVAL